MTTATAPSELVRQRSSDQLFADYERACDMTYRGTVDFFVIKAAYELGLFRHLADRAVGLEELAELTESRPNRLKKFTDMLVEMGLIEKNHDGALTLSGFSRQFFLPPNEDNENMTFEPFVRYALTVWEKYHVHLADVVRGRMDFTALTPWPPRTRQDSEFYEEIHRSNNLFVRDLIADEADLEGVTKLLDVGGGIGDIAIAAAERHPGLNVTLVNLPSAIELVNEHVAKYGLTDRIKAVSIDFYRDPYPECDAVLFARILYPFNAQVCQMILAKAFAALPSGGRVIIADMVLRDHRDLPNYDYLAHFITSVGVDPAMMTFKHQDEYFEVLPAVGFTDVRKTERHGHVLYQARKP